MSYFTHTKRKTKLKSLLAVLALSLFALALMTSPAFADPEKKVDDPGQITDEMTNQANDTKKDAEEAPIDVLPKNKMDEDAIKTAPDVPEMTAPVPETAAPKAAMPILDKAQSCYKQENGVTECICDGDKECAELTNSAVCEPGTDWRNEDGLGGCTKKAE